MKLNKIDKKILEVLRHENMTFSDILERFIEMGFMQKTEHDRNFLGLRVYFLRTKGYIDVVDEKMGCLVYSLGKEGRRFFKEDQNVCLRRMRKIE
jgi:hypothetical protein